MNGVVSKCSVSERSGSTFFTLSKCTYSLLINTNSWVYKLQKRSQVHNYWWNWSCSALNWTYKPYANEWGKRYIFTRLKRNSVGIQAVTDWGECRVTILGLEGRGGSLKRGGRAGTKGNGRKEGTVEEGKEIGCETYTECQSKAWQYLLSISPRMQHPLHASI